MKKWIAFIVVGVLWLSFCVWVSEQIAPSPSSAVAAEDPLLRQLSADNEALRQENATLRAELEACQPDDNVLPSDRGDTPEDDPGS